MGYNFIGKKYKDLINQILECRIRENDSFSQEFDSWASFKNIFQ